MNTNNTTSTISKKFIVSESSAIYLDARVQVTKIADKLCEDLCTMYGEEEGGILFKDCGEAFNALESFLLEKFSTSVHDNLTYTANVDGEQITI